MAIKKISKQISASAAALLIICLSFMRVSAFEINTDYLDEKINALLNYEYEYTNTGSLDKFVSDCLSKNAGTSTSDWFIISLSRYGADFDKALYADKLNSVLSDIYSKGYKNSKITDLQRLALAYSACSVNIQSIMGKNLLGDCSYNRNISELSSQGIITLDYALIVMDSQNYSVPQNAVTDRDDIISEILSLQLENGGFAITGTAADPDVTAMTITALAPYVKNSSAVGGAVEKALGKLSKMQKSDGGFASYGKLSCESSAQVIVALASLGINPSDDERFIKNDNSPVDAMLSFQLPSGGFSHITGGNENQMATYQAFYAMVALQSFLTKSQNLYNFSDGENPQQTIKEPAVSANTNTGSQNKSYREAETENNNAVADESQQMQNQSSAISSVAGNQSDDNSSTQGSASDKTNPVLENDSSPANLSEALATIDEAAHSLQESSVTSDNWYTSEISENPLIIENVTGSVCCGIIMAVFFGLIFARSFKSGGNKK